MLVRWLCSFPASALLDLVGLSTLVLPRPQAMHPSAKVREPTGCVFVQGRLKQVCPDGLAVTGFWARNAPYLPRQGQSPSCWTFMFTEGHDQRVPGYGGEDLQNDTKSKDKGKRPNQGRIAKRITLQRRIAQGDNLQITKLGDDQERRPTPFPSGAKRNGSE